MRPQLADSRGTGAVRSPLSPSQHAEALVELIRQCLHGIVVVIGPRGCGKTRFMRDRIEPRLQSSVPVCFYDCATEMPDAALHAITQEGVVILDSFDRFLQLSETDRARPLQDLFSKSRQATLVLVAGNHSMPDIFELRERAPDILEHVFQFPELRLSTELPRYFPSADLKPLDWNASTLDAVEKDLAQLGDSTVTPVLVAVIDKSFRADLYDQKNGLIGLLEKYLELTIGGLREDPALGENAVGVAAAILKEIAADGRSTLAGIAETFDVSADVPIACRERLKGMGLIRDSGAGELVLQPVQLQAVLARWLEDDRKACARSERYLLDGIDGRRKVGTLLPRERFDEIHAQRTLLRTTPEQSAFLTLCALRNYPDADSDPVKYWSRRIGDTGLEIGTLLEGLADSSQLARRRAASILAKFDEPRVQGQLCLAALEDKAAEVRQEAVESLATFPSKRSIRDVLVRAASEGVDETRIRAIHALRIFPDKECADFLEKIVGNPGDFAVRGAAIEALGRTHCEVGVAALVRVALRDAEREDRDRAAAALSRLGSEDLTEFGLNECLRDWEDQRSPHAGWWWKRLGHWPAALGMIVGSLFLHGLPLLPFRPLTSAIFFFIEIGAVTTGIVGAERNIDAVSSFMVLLFILNWLVSIVVAAWLSRRKQSPSGSFSHLLSNSMLALSMLTSGLSFHGIGHLITGRKRRALQLLIIQVLAIVAILATFALKNVFILGIERSGVDKLSTFLLYLYRFGGYVLSWLTAVSWLIMDERWGRRGPWLSEPHCRVIRSLLKAPESASLLRCSLDKGDRNAKSSSLLLAHFGDAVPGAALISVLKGDLDAGRRTPPQIVNCLSRFKDRKGYETIVSTTGNLLDELAPERRTQLIDVLASHPTESSIQCLVEHQRSLRFSERIRLVIAMIVRPFRGWHWTVRVAAVAMAGLALLIIVDGIRTASNPAWSDIKELRRSLRGDSPDIEVTADYLAKKYPLKSAEELVPAFREASKEGNINNAVALAPSLGVLATCGAEHEEANVDVPMKQILDPHAKPDDIEKGFEDLHKTLHAQAVVALLFVVSGQPPSTSAIGDATIRSLAGAADRGGSKELVSGLGMLYDNFDRRTAPGSASSTPQVQSTGSEQVQRAVTDMLVTIAANRQQPASLAAAEAITSRADSLGKLLNRSSDPVVKKSALDALEQSGSDAAVTAIKKFILSEGGLLLSSQAGNAEANGPNLSVATTQSAKLQRDFRSAAVDTLRRINTSAARDALGDLSKLQQNRAVLLPPEVAEKLSKRATAVPLVQQAQSLLQEGEIDQALTFAKKALQADPSYAEAHKALGSILYQSKSMRESLAQFRAATVAWPHDAQAYYMQAVILRELKRWSEAENALTTAIGIDPSYSNNYVLLRLIYTDQNKVREAVEVLQQLRIKYPGVAEINAQLTYLYHERVSLTDRQGFENAYFACQRWFELVRDHDPAEARRAEMDLDETRLTTGRYGEVIQSVPDLLKSGHLDVNQRMTLNVLLLSAQILQNDSTGALKTLDSLSELYDVEFRPADVLHNWVYDGTARYLETLQPRSTTTDALVELVRAVNKTSSRGPDGSPQVIKKELFLNLRRAIQSANSGKPSHVIG